MLLKPRGNLCFTVLARSSIGWISGRKVHWFNMGKLSTRVVHFGKVFRIRRAGIDFLSILWCKLLCKISFRSDNIFPSRKAAKILAAQWDVRKKSKYKNSIKMWLNIWEMMRGIQIWPQNSNWKIFNTLFGQKPFGQNEKKTFLARKGVKCYPIWILKPDLDSSHHFPYLRPQFDRIFTFWFFDIPLSCQNFGSFCGTGKFYPIGMKFCTEACTMVSTRILTRPDKTEANFIFYH